MPDAPVTLAEALRRHADERRDMPALHLIVGTETHTLTSGALYALAARYAAALAAAGVGAGDVVVLVLPHGQALIGAFWGAVLLGAVPSIFPFLSDKLDPARYYASVRAMTDHAQARLAVADDALYAPLYDVLAVPVVSLAQLALPADAAPPDLTIEADAVALLQHSSGSTGLQKGVMLSHRAVLRHLDVYSRAIRLTPDDVIASWLPLYHDMGLIAAFVLPIVCGIPLVLMSPFAWVRDPLMLWRAVTAHRATLCWLPNFACNFLALHASRAEGIDLASLRAVINCSEPIYLASHTALLDAYQAHGLRPDALATCYAMAENTFAVTQSRVGTPPPLDRVSRRALAEHRADAPADDADAVMLVASGSPLDGVQVRIVDAARTPLPERTIGEIMIQSETMLSGYLNRPDESAAALVDGWYATGDLGYLADGALYVTGRSKDLIIVGGKNIYPHDLEQIVNGVAGVHAGRVVAFGIANPKLGTEDVAIIAEVEAADAEARLVIERAVRASIAAQSEATARHVLLVARGWLVKTSSGKIARTANRDKFIAQTGIGQAPAR